MIDEAIKEPYYVASIVFMAGGVYGTGRVSIKAIQRACEEARDFAKALGGFREGAVVRISVFRIPAGHFWRQEDQGHMILRAEDDAVVGYATPLECIHWHPDDDVMTADYKELQRWSAAVAKANESTYPDCPPAI